MDAVYLADSLHKDVPFRSPLTPTSYSPVESARIYPRKRREKIADPQGWGLRWQEIIRDRQQRRPLRNPLTMVAPISMHLDPYNSSACGTAISAEHGRVDVSSLLFPSPPDQRLTT